MEIIRASPGEKLGQKDQADAEKGRGKRVLCVFSCFTHLMNRKFRFLVSSPPYHKWLPDFDCFKLSNLASNDRIWLHYRGQLNRKSLRIHNL